MKKLLISIVLSTMCLYANNSVRLDINNDTLGLEAQYNLNNVYNLNNDANYNFIVSYLKSEKTPTNKSSDSLLSAGLKMQNPYINDYGVNLGFGIKLVWVDNYNKSFTAMPFSIYVNYSINEDMSVEAAIDYSPKILSFSQAESFSQKNLNFNYKIIDNAFVYLGKRYVKTTYTDGISLKFDDSIFFGFKVLF